jgi:TPP-dependent pyruvate/acetoin dehydrogenase alpha subunit
MILSEIFQVLEKDLDEIQQELDSKQELYKLLSIYKNQEYPEKLLIIKNLQKELVDMKNVHEEEKAELIEMITKETNRYFKTQIDNENASVDKVTKKLTDQMHESLKDMAVQNGIMEKVK